MYKLCTTENSARQQRQFEATLATLLLEMPYDSITISELCRRAGLSRKTFYRLFVQKADVLCALLDHTFLDFENYQPDVSVVGQGEMHRFLAYWKEQKQLLDALTISLTSSLLAERAVLHVMKEDHTVRHSFVADSTPCCRETIVFFITGLFALVLDWHHQGYERCIDEMAQLLMSLLTTPPVKQHFTCDPCK